MESMGRIMIPRSANPVCGQRSEPAYKPKKGKRKAEPVDQEEAKKQKKCRWCRFRRVFFRWLEPAGSICIPPTPYRPDCLTGRSIDRNEWEVVQGNFPGPLNRYYTPDDPAKPEAYMYMAHDESQRLVPIPQYQQRYDDDNLPPYKWARLSNLPTPVVVDDSWPSLLAAQREKARLLETQSYVSSRIAEIDRKVGAVMDTKQKRDPDLQIRFVQAQMQGALFAVGLSDDARRTYEDVRAGRPVDPAEVGWLCELDKLFVLRERLSSLSLLSPPPAY
ncbi:hypothetical protein C8A01DRAFT_33565 [Parachaetomium inaequale]|uniref:Uncharacterized protein n=1 Tax=Parachaetomium inaequale TaxID=2588326 RepID=A0AAN6PNG5_9PEZI|nr:hypothetical protein C8A01DRAFT_33565 [Parachaetomium inaequale]